MARPTILAAIAALVAAPALAQPVTGQQAESQLFRGNDTTLQISTALSATDTQTIERLIPLFEQQMGGPIGYYATIAYSPDDGLVSDGLQSAVQFHSTRAADIAAITACNAAKSKGAGPCKVAARIVPRAYKPRQFTLSADATKGFMDGYRSAAAPKALAISPSTGKWAIAKGPGAGEAAVASCNSSAGRRDCEVAVAD